jgi:hypothetical protein
MSDHLPGRWVGTHRKPGPQWDFSRAAIIGGIIGLVVAGAIAMFLAGGYFGIAVWVAERLA